MITDGVWLIMLTIGILVLPMVVLSANSSPPGAAVFLLVWLGFVLFGAYGSLRSPHLIKSHADNTVEFVSRIGRLRVPASEIRSIKPGGNNIGFLQVQLPKKRVLILNQFDAFHEFLAELKDANPEVELRGC